MYGSRTKPGENYSRDIRPRLSVSQRLTGTMTDMGSTKAGEGVSLRGVRPALRISTATWLLVLLLERVAPLLP